MSQSTKIRQLHQILDLLEEFKNRKNCVFNFSKLANLLKISHNDLEEVMHIIFRFQQIFKEHFNGQLLCRNWKNNQIYFSLIPESVNRQGSEIMAKEIHINTEQSQILSDIIYYFQHVKIGKGFNLKINGTELSKKVKELFNTHPYLFENKGNQLIYPSGLAIQLGSSIRTYNKINRTIKKLQIDDCKIIIT